jgi:hypothetical protein
MQEGQLGGREAESLLVSQVPSLVSQGESQQVSSAQNYRRVSLLVSQGPSLVSQGESQ